jgi:hypothetical protein
VLGTRSVLLTLPIALLLVGCGSSDPGDSSDSGNEAAPTPSPTATSDSAASGACDLLSDDQVADLAGTELSEVHETQIVGALPACVWGSLNDVGVQAGVMEAGQWAHALPDAVDQFVASGIADEKNLRKLRAAADLIESGREIPDEQACALFSDLVELNGMRAGSDLSVAFVPNAASPQAVTAQVCRDGTYATVLVVRPDLTGADVEGAAPRQAVEGLLG